MFFLIVLSIAIFIWFWRLGFQSGYYVGKWWDNKNSLQEAFDDILRVALWPLNFAFNWSASIVDMYFGWNNPFDRCGTTNNSYLIRQDEADLIQ